jgi:alpha-tubulin suppressor-like RCC1 family protein
MGACVAGPPHLATMAANDQSTCAVRGTGDDATVVCWGNNRYGRLGYASNGPECTPVQGLRGAVSVAVGLDHACAVLRDRTVRCWGRNDRGQLGDGTTTDSAAPVVALRDVDVLEITAGSAHTCALLRSGALRCWGSNDGGQLGDGTTMNRPAPVTVRSSESNAAELTGISTVRAGGGTTCALKTDGTALCWGANNAGQLGDGTTTNRSAPVAVMGLTDGAELAVGGNAWACARRHAGTLTCWGSMRRAVASGLPPQMPPALAAMRDVEQLAAGATHLCARRVGGVVRCYTEDGNGIVYGVLGDPPDLASDMRSVRGAVSIAAGSNHNCVRFADGAMRCWGANGAYQLGVSGSLVLSTPVAPTCQVN